MMKKVNVFLAVVFFLFLSFGANAQQAQPAATGEVYFIGKWNILAKGLPQGDTKMVLTIEKKEGKLTGNLNDPASTDGLDDKNITGDIMGMFDIEGSRAN